MERLGCRLAHRATEGHEAASDVSLEETQLVAAALAPLPTAPKLALPVLRELVRIRRLVTVQSVFEEFVEI
jgi:hypothetical protein